MITATPSSRLPRNLFRLGSTIRSALPAGTRSAGRWTWVFTFKFYGRFYTQVYISTNGLLSLGAPVSSSNKTLIPSISLPNNLIAPFWAPMTGTSGIIRYHLEGTAPNRKFAVEWQNVAMRNPPPGSTNQAWFQAILKESGEIVFYYFTFPDSAQPSVGIEDESGWYGNGMGSAPFLIAQTSWHFAPPAAAARVKLTPPVQDAFATPGAQVSFPLTVLNAGDVGTDTFKITPASAWTVALFQADGITPLGDSDADGKPDTGPLAAGASLDIVVKAQHSPGGRGGDGKHRPGRVRLQRAAGGQEDRRGAGSRARSFPAGLPR